MAKRTRKSSPPPRDGQSAVRPVAGLRIIGGRFRGRKLHYSGDMRTRPMKDRLREAIFNLIGPSVRGGLALDLFAGTGALGLEAMSRGAERALLIEQHNPTANLVRKSISELDIVGRAEVAVGNTFLWWKMHHADAGLWGGAMAEGTAPTVRPWIVFCSPPYDFYVERAEEVLELLASLIEAAPVGSVFAVEADDRFDFQQLPYPTEWDVRAYSPAVVGILRKQGGVGCG